jgi:spermidine synthase
MRQRELIAESTTPDGESLTLSVEHGEYVVRVRGETLMSARLSGSEQAMAKLALDAGALKGESRILVGGLGMGFTLRAVLDQAQAGARIRVVELLADVVQWNRGPLASLARNPLDDPRVSVRVGDLLDYLAGCVADNTAGYDAILLDIDNGPEAFTVAGNDRLYRSAGLALLHGALRDDGVMIVWSAFRSTSFEKRLRQAGFAARTVTVRARADVAKGARHTLFVASRSQSSTAQPQHTGRARRRRPR